MALAALCIAGLLFFGLAGYYVGALVAAATVAAGGFVYLRRHEGRLTDGAAGHVLGKLAAFP